MGEDAVHPAGTRSISVFGVLTLNRPATGDGEIRQPFGEWLFLYEKAVNSNRSSKDCFAVPAFSIECNDSAGETGDKEKNADGFKAKRNDRIH